MLWSLLPEDSFDTIYDMGCRIGKGGFGEVYEATLRIPRDDQPMKYAVKRANRAGISPDVEQGIRDEVTSYRFARSISRDGQQGIAGFIAPNQGACVFGRAADLVLCACSPHRRYV